MILLRWSYRGLILILEIFCDLAGIFISFFLAHWIYVHFVIAQSIAQPTEKFFVCGFVGLLILATFHLNDLYRKNKSILNIEETRLILKSLLIVGLVVFTLMELFREIRQPKTESFFPLLTEVHASIAKLDLPNMFSRIETSLFFVLMFPILSLFRYVIFKFQQSLHLRGVGNERILIYGKGDLARRLQNKIVQSPKSGYFLIGLISDEPSSSDVRYLGRFENLEAVCKLFSIDRLIVADASMTPDRMVEVLHKSQDLKIQLEFVPALHSLFVHRIHLNDVDGLPLISVKNLNGSWWQRFVKRIFDVVLGSLLLILSVPLWLILAVWIKIDSRGPIFFHQRRIGYHSKIFNMYKFRTMDTKSEAYAPTPESSLDPRITKSGRWLRRFSLDELPQLINVLKGEMSLVGPRPEMPFITEKYSPQEQERLRIKPGITGLWQISADRKLQIHKNLDYDLYYIEHQGILLDIVILMRTIYSVVRGSGAW